MKFKQICKTFLLMSAWGLLVIVFYIGVLTVLANYPEAPEGESEWGWLGEIFHLHASSSDLLAVKSKKVIIPTEIADVSLNKQVPTKEYVDDYVDKKVKAMSSGGGSLPIMISERASNLTWLSALRYCANLEEGGYTDWRLPTIEELAYAVGEFNVRDNLYLWTRTPSGGSTDTYWLVLRPAYGNWSHAAYYTYDYRTASCVR